MSARSRWILLLLVLCALTAASYGPAFQAGFVYFDDVAYIKVDSPIASGLTLDNVRWSLTGVHSSNWHPLTWISHMIDVELFGFEPEPHHVENILFHVLNVALLFLVLRALTGEAAPSFVVAALFAVHPANVESVAWISQRKTVLSTLFALLSIGSYARYARGGGIRPYGVSLLCLGLSLASKPMFVTLPFALLLLDYWPLRRPAFESAADGRTPLLALLRGWLRLLPEKIPFALVCGGVIWLTLDAQVDAMSPIDQYTLSDRLANVAISYVKYIGIYFAPRNLAAFYPLFPDSMTPRLVYSCFALLLGVSVVATWLGLRYRHLLVGWFWFLGTLVPVIGLVHVGRQAMADRYVYVPFWGLSIAVVWSLRGLFAMPRFAPAARAASVAIVVPLVLVFAVLTWRQSRAWHDGITLFESAVANTPDNWLAHGALAERFYATAEFEKSIEHSKEALKYDRNLGTFRSTYGLALYAIGEHQKALEQFELAAHQEPDNPVGYMNLGWLKSERGDYDGAIADLRNGAAAISHTTSPYTRKMIYANWASALEKKNQLPEARKMYVQALEFEPDGIALLCDLAHVDLQMGNTDDAVAGLRRAIELAPSDIDSAYLLASATLLQDRSDESATLFQDASTREPRKAVVAIDLARALARQGRRDEAYRILDALLALPPPADAADAEFVRSTVEAQRAEIEVEAGDAPAAIASLERAVAIWPDNYDANNRLAFLLAASSDPALLDPARAVALAERATSTRREFGSLSTLAAAHAAAGNLPAAIATTREAQDLAVKANDARAIAALEQQLRLYTEAAGDVSDARK